MDSWIKIAVLVASIVTVVAADETIRCTNCVMGSQTDENECGLSFDDDVTTRSESGYEIGAWQRCRLDRAYNVTGVQLKGIAAPYQIRVGTGKKYGFEGGFDTLQLCVEDLGGLELEVEKTVTCKRPIEGEDVYVRIVDPDDYEQLAITDLQVMTI